MILSICPNPSIDCTIELDNLNVGMLNRINNKVETYSGKALNVAIGVARLNKPCVATGFMFEDHKSMFEHVLKKEGVEYDFVYSPGASRTNYKIIDRKSMLTEINDKGAEVSVKKQYELIDKITELSKKCTICVMSGSLPSGVSKEFYGQALSVIPKDVKVIVDAEKDNVLSAVASRPIFMVKPNLKELESFAGKNLSSKAEIAEACKGYVNLGVKYVMVSLGSEGAILTDGKRNLYCKSANVAVNSTVGAGDSMVAAICSALIDGCDQEEMLLRAVSAGTAAVTTSGTNLFYKDKYDEIYSKIFVEEF